MVDKLLVVISDGIQEPVRTRSWNAGLISEPVLAFRYRPVVLNRG